MNTHFRLFASCMVLCLFSQAPWVQGQTFQQVKFLKVVGDKTKEVKAHLIVAGDSIRVLGAKSARTLKEVPYSEIKAASYSFSKHRRWRAGLAVAAAVHVFAAPLFFMKGKKHWLTLETEEDYLGLRLDKSNFEEILAAVDRRLKDTAAFDGYRDGASRSGMTPPIALENKGESPLDKKRILVADQSRSRARDLDREDSNQMPRELREWITAYLEDLPNFICDYTEAKYEHGGGGWELKHKHQGEARYIDGKAEYRVVAENGLPVEKTVWEVTTTGPHAFHSLRGFLNPSANYRFTPRGEGEISFQSDAGQGLVRGWTKDGRPKDPQKSYPTWGTLWAQEPQHRIRGVMEYFTVPDRGLLGVFTSGFPPGERSLFREYGPVNIGEKSYWLLKQLEFTTRSASGAFSARRAVQTYHNCRRFQAKSLIQYGGVIDAPSATPANKGYGTEVAAAQPGLKRAAGGGMGGELPTPPLAHETGLEVAADLDSAQSPDLSPQDPRAASQPPLSKTVRTSPKRPLPSGRTPASQAEGQPPKSDEDSLATNPKRYPRIFPTTDPGEGGRRAFPRPPSNYKLYQPEPKDRLTVPEPREGIAQRYGYKPGYGYYPTVSSEKAESPRGDPEADDPSGLWWVVLMSGIAAFAGGFFGNFLRGKSSDTDFEAVPEGKKRC